MLLSGPPPPALTIKYSNYFTSLSSAEPGKVFRKRLPQHASKRVELKSAKNSAVGTHRTGSEGILPRQLHMTVGPLVSDDVFSAGHPSAKHQRKPGKGVSIPWHFHGKWERWGILGFFRVKVAPGARKRHNVGDRDPEQHHPAPE